MATLLLESIKNISRNRKIPNIYQFFLNWIDNYIHGINKYSNITIFDQDEITITIVSFIMIKKSQVIQH